MQVQLDGMKATLGRARGRGRRGASDLADSSEEQSHDETGTGELADAIFRNATSKAQLKAALWTLAKATQSAPLSAVDKEVSVREDLSRNHLTAQVLRIFIDLTEVATSFPALRF